MSAVKLNLLAPRNELFEIKNYPCICDVCGEYGMICLNGQRFLCWDHYCDEMKKDIEKENVNASSD